MFFKDLKPESNLYVYNRKDTSVIPARVVSVSQPHLENSFNKQNNPLGGYNSSSSSMQMYVDVVLDINGTTTPPYVCPETSEIVYAGDTVLCPDITPIIREIENAKNLAEQQLNMRSILEERVAKCEKILLEYNPALREKKEIDSRFNKLENSFSKMEQMMTRFFEEWNGKK